VRREPQELLRTLTSVPHKPRANHHRRLVARWVWFADQVIIESRKNYGSIEHKSRILVHTSRHPNLEKNMVISNRKCQNMMFLGFESASRQELVAQGQRLWLELESDHGGISNDLFTQAKSNILGILKIQVRTSIMKLQTMKYFCPVVIRIVKTQRYSNFVIYHIPWSWYSNAVQHLSEIRHMFSVRYCVDN
jgi:hypothetical protein